MDYLNSSKRQSEIIFFESSNMVLEIQIFLLHHIYRLQVVRGGARPKVCNQFIQEGKRKHDHVVRNGRTYENEPLETAGEISLDIFDVLGLFDGNVKVWWVPLCCLECLSILK
jgi:hypothetical protein